ncbi:MAG TPA: hypothetical protein VKB47_08705 [Terracidiphilus sp.]|nr:hypothetical protein [Terracidiphilus sp.]
MESPNVVDVPIEGVDKNAPDLTDLELEQIRVGLEIPSAQGIYSLCRELAQWRSGERRFEKPKG